MNASSSSQIAARRPHGAFPAIFFAGLLAGVLDITAAFVTWSPQGVPPMRILQGIASGLLGPQAFNEGAASALLGGTIHFLIAFSAAAVFYAASRKIDFMTRRPIFAGVLYGVCVYVVMYWIVMPLAKMHPAHTLTRSIVAIVTHMVCVGMPISLLVRRYSAVRWLRCFAEAAQRPVPHLSDRPIQEMIAGEKWQHGNSPLFHPASRPHQSRIIPKPCQRRIDRVERFLPPSRERIDFRQIQMKLAFVTP